MLLEWTHGFRIFSRSDYIFQRILARATNFLNEFQPDWATTFLRIAAISSERSRKRLQNGGLDVEKLVDTAENGRLQILKIRKTVGSQCSLNEGADVHRDERTHRLATFSSLRFHQRPWRNFGEVSEIRLCAQRDFCRKIIAWKTSWTISHSASWRAAWLPVFDQPQIAEARPPTRELPDFSRKIVFYFKISDNVRKIFSAS